MQVKGKPRFFLFVAYGSQQFGLDFGHRKIFFFFFFRKGLFASQSDPLEATAPQKGPKEGCFQTEQMSVHTSILEYPRSWGLGLQGLQTPASPKPEGQFFLEGKEGGCPQMLIHMPPR